VMLRDINVHQKHHLGEKPRPRCKS